MEMAHRGVVRAVSRPAGPARRPAGRSGARGRVRLTRRGRVVVLVFFLLLAGIGAAVAAPASRAAGRNDRASDRAHRAPAVVVGRDDTLWSIAERHLPGRQPARR